MELPPELPPEGVSDEGGGNFWIWAIVILVVVVVIVWFVSRHAKSKE